MQARVMTAAEPADVQRFVVMVVMRVNRAQTADFADLLCKVASLDGSLHGEMCVVLRWIGSTPVRLSRVGLQHCRFSSRQINHGDC
jgi:hypothetical protein